MPTSKELYAEYVVELNKMESDLHRMIHSFLILGDDSISKWIRLCLDRALNDSRIFPGLQHKIEFVNHINNVIAEKANEVGCEYDKEVWPNLRKRLINIQKTRNGLAHQWISFLPNDKVVYNKIKRGSTNLTKVELELVPSLEVAKKLHLDLIGFSIFFQNQALKIFKDAQAR